MVKAVRFLAILDVIGGALAFVLAFAQLADPSSRISQYPAGFWLVVGVISMPLGAWLASAHKSGVRSAWTVQLIVSLLGLLSFPIGTIIHLSVLCFWFKPDVKDWYGLMGDGSYTR